jgi:Predicted dehydrogenases and related proteins
MRRRHFLFATGSALSASRILGANDRVHVGLIGCGGRGRYVAGFMRQVPNVHFSAVCDVWREKRLAAKQWAGPDTAEFSDFRKLLEHKPLDAVLVATPDHWHAIPTIFACQAGKDVYVEKPLAHNVREGRAMVEAARRYKRIVQVGTQHRSAPHYAEVAQIVQSGGIGEVRFVRVWNYSNMLPNGIGHADDEAVPDGVDWDMYLGPAPMVPYNRLRIGPTYRWFWDYAGGTITDFGVHRFDTVNQVMNAKAPLTVSATGGRYVLKDDGQMPDLLQVTWEFPGWVLSYEACNFNSHGTGGRTPGMKYYHAKGADDRPHGEAYYGTKGTLMCDRLGYEIYPGSEGVQRVYKNSTDATALHARNFIECVRSRKRPNADVELGHWGTNIAHLGNIAYKTRRKLVWDSVKEDFEGAAEASALLSRKARKPWDIIG